LSGSKSDFTLSDYFSQQQIALFFTNFACILPLYVMYFSILFDIQQPSFVKTDTLIRQLLTFFTHRKDCKLSAPQQLLWRQSYFSGDMENLFLAKSTGIVLFSFFW